ncbi:hypothetical protein Q3O59_11030 [Alkalimonas delamerensis]|uniref:Outer membrane protein beta-barrel domain-containing protein n=1 Tax=Alkalimonas delamerensis TaxID=265981 RepID=A0ABT9GS07_9GAMM|nr:hypothetical protein [Alkalimonas delamerensis]MDP4529555.1 hypothetical protein [Alkalimonas delamerensis]
MTRTLLILPAVLFSAQTLANGGLFLVDDAAITDEGRCSLDAWWTRQEGAGAGTVIPMCTRSGFEWGLPLTFASGSITAYGLEAKTLLAAPTTDSALAFSTGLMLARDGHRLEEVFINLPFSQQWLPWLELHVNLGALYQYQERDLALSWGAAVTAALWPELAVILESAGIGREDPTLAAGLRWQPMEQWELDLSFGRELESSSNYLAVGFNLAF